MGGEDLSAPKLGPRFEQALAYAAQLHRRQLRNGTTIPYISHLLGVASIALEIGADEDQAIAALPHDAVEDQGGEATLGAIGERFGGGVASIVADCTDTDEQRRPPWRERKERYIARLATKPERSLLVSLADKTHNARAILDDLVVHGPALWDRFTGGRHGSLWYYGALAAAFQQVLPGVAADRLSFIVAEMQRVAAGVER
jgi:(p)ppGpp synthase/HD superfamily hydrolase